MNIYQDESTVHLETINQLQSNIYTVPQYQEQSNTEILLSQYKLNVEIPPYENQLNNLSFKDILDNIVNIINRLENRIQEEKLNQRNYNEIFIKLFEKNEKNNEENRKLIEKINEDNKKLLENQEKINNRLLNLLEKKENKTAIKGEM